ITVATVGDDIVITGTGGGGGGVDSIAKSGDPALTGAVTLSEGANVTITQVGQDIEIASTGGGPADTDGLAEGALNLYFTDTRARTAAVSDSITDGVTDVGPSQNAVFDA